MNKVQIMIGVFFVLAVGALWLVLQFPNAGDWLLLAIPLVLVATILAASYNPNKNESDDR